MQIRCQLFYCAISCASFFSTQGLAADVVSYNAALSACASGRQWAAALSVLQHMRQEGVNPNVVSFNAVLSACQRSGQWERALMLLDDMRQVIIPLYCCLIFVTVVIVVLVDII